MTIRFCGACGTEVDETAAFCPSCGRPVDEERAPTRQAPTWDDGDEELAGQQTAAWTTPSSAPGGDEPAPEPEEQREQEPETGPPADGAPPDRDATPAEQTSRRSDAAPASERSDGGRRSGPSLRSVKVPVTWPLTLSGWLVGVGAVVGALALFLPWTIAPGVGFFDRWGLLSPVNLLLLVGLLAIAASVFFSAHVPDFAHRRLAILVVVLIGLGVGLDRLGIGAVGSGAILFFLAMLAATIGALLVEVGADRPMSGPVT